ncbi:MAG: hypothetical protein IJC56_09070, partial [Clostridia bacterium]|nr:hypothetical protein [Clostridia bacterium]
MNKYDEDIRMLMRRDSVSGQLIAFVLAAIYGVVSGAAALRVRELVLSIARRVIYTAELEINQYRGFVQLWEIGTITVLVAVWLILVLIVWHRVGKAICIRERLKTSGAWSAGAAVL